MLRDATRTFDALEARWKGTFHFRAIGLSQAFDFAHGEREVLPTASTAKFCILCELFRQSRDEGLNLDQQVRWPSDSWRGGDGVLKVMRPEASLSWYNLAVLMMIVSDNIATQVVLNRVGGRKVTRFMRSLGLRDTFVPEAWPGGPTPGAEAEPMSTAWDLCRLAARVYRKEILDPDACADILSILRQNQCRDMLPRRLPVGEDHEGDAPEWIAHKQGCGPCRVEVGIVHTREIVYAMALFFKPRHPLPARCKSLAEYPPTLAAAEGCATLHQGLLCLNGMGTGESG